MKLITFSILVSMLTYCSSCKEPVVEGPFPIIISPAYIGEHQAHIPEISGLSLLNDSTLLAINDGGSPAKIFEIDRRDNTNFRQIHVRNQMNTDWEAIVHDENYVYIGEFGNNAGQRKDLQILKINKSEITQDSINTSKIHFNYKEQLIYNSPEHDFDCEAMIPYGDELILFTKHRGNSFTHLYRIPKDADTTTIEIMDRFDVGGQVTAASLSEDKKVLALLGYNWSFGHGFDSFLWLFYDFQDDAFFNGKSIRLDFDQGRQYESMTFTSLNDLLITHEYSTGETSTKFYMINIAEYIR